MRPIIIANWKMNRPSCDFDHYIKGLNHFDKRNVKVGITPSFVDIGSLSRIIEETDSHVMLGAQDCHHEAHGAFTGDVSATLLRTYHTQYVIIGHSEQREYHSYNSQFFLKKAQQAINHGLQVIFCVGEKLDAREKNQHKNVVREQLLTVCPYIQDIHKHVVIAYEPVWAIGTGRAADPSDVQDMHHYIRELLRDSISNFAANNMPILYGGSVKPDNASSFFACNDVNGALIGNASLDIVRLEHIISLV